jgi:hypothetical protein
MGGAAKPAGGAPLLAAARQRLGGGGGEGGLTDLYPPGCFVCNSQYHGLVEGGAPAPATGGLARARLLPLSPPRAFGIPPFGHNIIRWLRDLSIDAK